MIPSPLKQLLLDGKAAPMILGPTASGKSALAMEIAETFGGEIISVDSMQFYRGLDIGTAKPTKAEQQLIPHHLIDTMELQEKSDVFLFCERAEQALKDIRARGRLPVLVGGSGLYSRALMYGLDSLPARQSLRDELDARYDQEETFSELQSIMREKCPLDFERWHSHRRKLIRAYEVYLLSGEQISTLQQMRHSRSPRPDLRTFTLQWDREILKQRIAVRCEDMLEHGWIEETRRLIARGLLESPTAWQALGYSLIAEYLAGRLPRSELSEKITIATRQFARRQITWFRHQHPESTVISMPLSEHS